MAPSWTNDDLRRFTDRVAYRGNPDSSVVPGPELERVVQHAPLAAVSGSGGSVPRFHVRITSYRRKLLDPDNISGGCTSIINLIRRAGIIPDDDPETIRLEVLQQKVGTIQEERTEVDIFPISPSAAEI